MESKNDLYHTIADAALEELRAVAVPGRPGELVIRLQNQKGNIFTGAQLLSMKIASNVLVKLDKPSKLTANSGGQELATKFFRGSKITQDTKKEI